MTALPDKRDRDLAGEGEGSGISADMRGCPSCGVRLRKKITVWE